MKIVIACDVLGKPNNGTTLAGLNLINYLTKKGHDVVVICPDEDKKDWPNYYILPKKNFGFILNKIIEKNKVVLCKPKKEILEKALEGADIVHSILPFEVGRNVLKLCLEKHIPITSGFHAQAENFTSHIFMMNFPFANWCFYKITNNLYYKKVNAIHFPTKFICDYVKPYGIESKHPYIISNGVQTNIFYYDPKIEKKYDFGKRFVVLMSGRLCKEKHQKFLIDALCLCKHEKDIQLVLCGDGPDHDRIERRCAKKLTNRAFIKSFDHFDLVNILRSADLYVHSSIAEIEAISCLEALACGLVPVISNSNRSATSKFALSEKSLFDYKSKKDLADKIDYWFENRDELLLEKQKYADFAKQFNFDDCIAKMEKMLIEVKENYEKERIKN